MEKIIITYWSQTGNTENMANAITDGAKSAGADVMLLPVSEVCIEDIKNAKAVAFGCPAMGSEVLEETEMEPFMEEAEKFISGKKTLLFGSFGWGDGQWMRDWEDRIRSAGASLVGGEGIICQELPDESILDNCRTLGRQLAE